MQPEIGNETLRFLVTATKVKKRFKASTTLYSVRGVSVSAFCALNQNLCLTSRHKYSRHCPLEIDNVEILTFQYCSRCCALLLGIERQIAQPVGLLATQDPVVGFDFTFCYGYALTVTHDALLWVMIKASQNISCAIPERHLR
jgi:hypothetical protein